MPPADIPPFFARARPAIVALCAVMAANVAVVVTDVVSLQWLDEYDIDALSRYDLVTGLFGLVELVAVIVAAVFFVRWFSAAHRSLDGICPGVRRHDTFWSIAGWFIPFMSIFRPKQIVNDMLECARGDQRQPWWAPAWWVLWLLTSVGGNAAGRLTFEAETLEQYRTATTVDAVSSGLFFVTGLAAVLVVRRLTDLLEAKRAEVARRPPEPPPLGPVSLAKAA